MNITEWVVRCSAKAGMATLALAGITGMYLRQHRRAGLLGLAGYLVGGLLFGIALFRTRVLARWPSTGFVPAAASR